MKKKFILLCLFCSFSINAQKNNKKNLLSYGISFNFHRLIDNAISPINYKGLSGGLTLGYHYRSNATLVNAEVYASGGFYNYNDFPSFKYREVNLYYSGFKSNYVKYVYRWKGIKWFLGGGINAFAHLNEKIGYSNSKYNYSVVVNLSVDNVFLHDLKWFDIPFQVAFKLKIPLMGFVVRPFYSTNFMGDGILGNKEFTMIGDYFHWATNLGWYYTLSNGNSLGVDYQWSYWSYSRQNVIQQAKHSLFFKLYYHL